MDLKQGGQKNFMKICLRKIRNNTVTDWVTDWETGRNRVQFQVFFQPKRKSFYLELKLVKNGLYK